ncbi:hypothetical protein JX266_013604 [Neoarthrinium moseri]|nr:hypothetical protein JX266_013604 [Neoarthrinium moseri]
MPPTTDSQHGDNQEDDMSNCEENDVLDDRDLDILRGVSRASHCSGPFNDGSSDSERAPTPDQVVSSHCSSPQSTVEFEQPDPTIYGGVEDRALSSIEPSPAAMSINSVDGLGQSQRSTRNGYLEMIYSRPSAQDSCDPGSCTLANHALRLDHRDYGRRE